MSGQAPLPGTTPQPQPAPGDAELLKRAADALWKSAKAALTVEHSLDKPYEDDPRWSPWTRWVERPAREAHDLAMVIRKRLKAAPEPQPAPGLAADADRLRKALESVFAVLDRQTRTYAERISYARTLIRTALEGK